jgi:hypothetical protein
MANNALEDGRASRRRAAQRWRYVAGMSGGWWLTPNRNGGPLIAISGHPGPNA